MSSPKLKVILFSTALLLIMPWWLLRFFTFLKRKKGEERFVALKHDMSKVYDRVEWGFLRAMCSKLGFDKKWIDLAMRCVSTVSYSLLINGFPPTPLFPLEASVRGILSRLICSLFVQKVSLLFLNRWKLEEILLVSKSCGKPLRSLISYLQMIAFFFPGQTKMKLTR